MTGSIERAVAEIPQGKRYPVYLLHGDEFLTRGEAKTLIDALVPPGQAAWSVETVAEETDLASLPLRLNTLPLFGGTKVVVVYDSKAFLSKQTAGNLTERSFEAWQAGDGAKAVRLFLQILGTAAEDARFLDRAARGEVSESEWKGVFAVERDPEKESWLQEVAATAVAEDASIPEAASPGSAHVYEDTLQRGIPPATSLILTAEVVDQRRSLFKRISELGLVIDCGVRTKKAGETQMNPDVARTRIREIVKGAKKTIEAEAVTAIVDRTGFSVRGLESEVEKILLYVGSRPDVSATDVMAVLSTSREAGVFDLTNAMSARDAGKALVALRGLLAQREPVQRILGMLAGEIRMLLLARCVLDARLGGQLDPTMPFPAFQARILPRLKETREGDDGSAAQFAEMHPFRAFNVLRSASRFSLQELLRALEAIQETDLALKTSGHPEGLLLERLLIAICSRK
jgi:DNA polymerase III subunit delta